LSFLARHVILIAQFWLVPGIDLSNRQE